MATRILLAGASGWVGKALVAAIARADDLTLSAAVARGAAGRDAGAVAGVDPVGTVVVGTVAEALAAPSDVLIDYTKPDVVKQNVLAALAEGLHAVIGASGLSAADYADIEAAANAAGRGVLAAGNFSITATLMRRFALEAARYVDDVEIIDYAHRDKPDAPSGTARELAELLGAVRRPATSRPVANVVGLKDARGAAVGAPHPVQVHSLRMPSYVIACEVLMGADNERLTIRHDAGVSAAPYVAGTLLAARRVSSFVGLRRGLDAVM